LWFDKIFLWKGGGEEKVGKSEAFSHFLLLVLGGEIRQGRRKIFLKKFSAAPV